MERGFCFLFPTERFGNYSETGKGKLSFLFPSALRVIQSRIQSMLSSMIPRHGVLVQMGDKKPPSNCKSL